MTRYGWTQPACAPCFDERNPGRTPASLSVKHREECAYCGETTYSGIYVRVDPKTAAHPTLVKS